MALFKILKGSESGLPTTKTPGYMYITEDQGNIYVDLSTTKRIQLNAKNAMTANKWAAPITLSLSGDASGSVNIDGSANADISVTVKDDSHNHVISNIDNLQTTLDSKAPTSHASSATTYGIASNTLYGHAMASSTTPKANGTATVGSETSKFARGDHIHPLQTEVETAEKDAEGNVISNYISGVSVSGQTVTFTRGDGTTFTIITQDTDTNNDSKVQTTEKTTGTGYVTTCTGATTGGLNYHTSVYVDHANGVLMGAAWNDYAEYRETKVEIEPGRVVIETGNGDLVLSQERLAPAPNIVSDTFGFAIGKTKKCNTPIAISGRALVYPFEDREIFKAGDVVCAGPEGTVSLMSREEIKEYPDRIIGIVSEIPNYKTWGETDIEVNNRIWIKIK